MGGKGISHNAKCNYMLIGSVCVWGGHFKFPWLQANQSTCVSIETTRSQQKVSSSSDRSPISHLACCPMMINHMTSEGTHDTMSLPGSDYRFDCVRKWTTVYMREILVAWLVCTDTWWQIWLFWKLCAVHVWLTLKAVAWLKLVKWWNSHVLFPV